MSKAVKRINWAFTKGNEREPAIRIQTKYSFIIVPITAARNLVDQVHDACDEHDREHRERNN